MRRLCFSATLIVPLVFATQMPLCAAVHGGAITRAAALSIVDIGGYGTGQGAASVALAVSNGLVVGDALTAGGRPNAVSTRGAGLTNIGAGLDGTLAAAVNASGVAVGQAFFPGPTQQRAVIFTGGREINLGALPGDTSSIATAINAHGIVVGTSTPSTSTGYVSQPFVYQNGNLSAIAPIRAIPRFIGANAQGINDAGVIVGSVAYGRGFIATTASYAVSGKTVTVFATIHGNGNSVATAINASGVVTGYHSTFSFSVNAPLHAYTYTLAGGVFTDLGTLYPKDSFANSVGNAVNGSGAVVGYSQPSGGQLPPRATVFVKGLVIDLNTLIPPNSGWLLETATGIDDLGNIVGIGFHNSIERGFILRTGTLFKGSSR